MMTFYETVFSEEERRWHARHHPKTSLHSVDGVPHGFTTAPIRCRPTRCHRRLGRRRLQELELLDEIEEFQMLLQHYCVVLALKDAGDLPILDTITLAAPIARPPFHAVRDGRRAIAGVEYVPMLDAGPRSLPATEGVGEGECVEEGEENEQWGVGKVHGAWPWSMGGAAPTSHRE